MSKTQENSHLNKLLKGDKPTPRPWKIDDNPQLPLGIIQDDEDGYGIAEFAYDHAKDRANAELIVRAVNCHDELIEAVSRFLDHALNGKEQTRLSVNDLTRFNNLLKRAKGEV